MVAATPRSVSLALAGLILLASGALLFYRLGAEPFYDYDEATYTEVVHEGAVHGNFLTFSFLNQPFFKKPPLLFWLMDGSMRVPMKEEAALRIPGALAALATIALVMLLIFEAGGSAPSALLAGAILATTSAFIEPARQVRFDILVSFFILATFYAFLRAERDRRWYLAAGTLFGLAVLSKSVIAVFAMVAILAYLVMLRRFVWLRDPYVWGGAALALLIIVPWHLYETLRYGTVFWQSYLGTEVFDRVRTNLFGEGAGTTTLQLFGYLFTLAAPWAEFFLAFLAALPFLYTRMETRLRGVFIASLVTILAIVAVVATAQTKATTYFIPLYPFLALALGLGLGEIFRQCGPKVHATARTAVIVGLIFASSIIVYNAFHINPYFAFEVEKTKEEAAIGALVRGFGPDATLYTYDENDLGTVQYYSRLPFSNHPFVLLLGDDSVVKPNSYVLTVRPENAVTRFPNHRFTTLYTGTYVSLLRIDS